MLWDSAMIVRLGISQWTAKKYDKKVSNKIADDYNVSRTAGQYRKALVAEEAIRDVQKIATEARNFHYEQTLPWDDVGGRLLPSANFEAYSTKMRELRGKFEEAVRAFVDSYSDYRNKAKQELKGMFDSADYPQDVGRKYNFETNIEPVPTAQDFRVRLQDDDVTRIKSEIEKRLKERESEAREDLFLRLHTVVEHFAEKLNDPDSIFRDTLVGNIVELVDLLPRLNVMGDKKLEALSKEVKVKLCGFEPENLRKDRATRAKAADSAADILKKMGAYTGKK